MNEKQIDIHPFTNYASCCEKVVEMKCSDTEKNILRSIALRTQCPSHLGNLKNASMLAIKLGLLSSENSDIARTFLATFSNSEKSIRAKAADYPVYFGLQYIFKRADISDQMKSMIAKVFVAIFDLDRLKGNKIDPSIFQTHVFTCRSILSGYSKYFLFHNKDVESFSAFRESILTQCSEYLENSAKNSDYYDINLLNNLLTGQIFPGQRQKKKTSHSNPVDTPAVDIVSPQSATLNNQKIVLSYPAENSQTAKTICRDTPKSGSKLNRNDDRRALRGRINYQASRNIVLITDMHRLPLPQIVRFLSMLDTCPEGIVLGWVILTTGMTPDRLLRLKLNMEGNKIVCLHPDTGILHYTVNNRPDTKHEQLMQLQMNPFVGNAICSLHTSGWLSGAEESLQRIIGDFSVHNPGQSTTMERISSSSVLHFSRGFLSELEAAHLAGDIPAKLRAQVHYYPIDLADLNRKWQDAHQSFAERILNMDSCTGSFRSFLESLERFPRALPSGTIGSIHGKPVKSLQQLINAIEELARQLNVRIHSALSFEKLPLIVDFIQIQHLQLYLVEQLCFGSRKFGSKTQYALAPSKAMGWGREKASAVFSVERKTIPLVGILQSQIEACESDWKCLIKATDARGVSVLGNNFHKCSAPLPAEVTLNIGKRQIYVKKMSSSGFSDVLEKYDLPSLPPTTLRRIHLIKHIVASELVGKIPQVLLDELLTHDRDGLDFCAPWSTGSTVAMDQLRQAIRTMLSQLNIQKIALEGCNV